MKRVVAYCRVSTDKDDQINSLESQKRYFEEYINKSAEWDLIEIYADEGKSGTSTKKRNAFNKMIQDAENERFDLVLTKEISRFARNTLDSIFYTRKLKELGIAVIFLNDNINTLDPDSELRLTIMSSIAQEESRKTSERVKWGQRRQMERGIAFGTDPFGYDRIDGKLVINEKEAEIVKYIFNSYLCDGKGLNRIAMDLEEKGVKTKLNNAKWTASSISRLLKNEKYCGDLRQRKTYTTDFLTHKIRHNQGEEEFVCIQDTHESIIDRQMFDAAQQEIAKRTNKEEHHRKYSSRYAFSGKLQCGICNAGYISRNKGENKNRKVVNRWQCSNAFKYGKRHLNNAGQTVGCESIFVRDEILQQVFLLALNDVIANKQQIIDEVVQILETVLKQDTSQQEEKDLEKQLQQLENKRQKLIDLFLDNTISKNGLKTAQEKIDMEAKAIIQEISKLQSQNRLTSNADSIISDIKQHISKMVNAEVFSEEIVKETLERIVIYSKTKYDVYFKGSSRNFFLDKQGVLLSPRYRFCYFICFTKLFI